MKKFLIKLLLYIIIMTVCVLGSIVVLEPQFSTDYTASIVDKVERLESIQGPKLILVGNSNLALGMDSSILEKELGIPVVNMGLHGGLGNQFNYNVAKYNIAPGDIVVLSNTHFDEGVVIDPPLAWITIENGEDYWRLIPKESWPDMLRAFPNYVVDTLSAFASRHAQSVRGLYSRSAFNAYGDNVVSREEGQMVFSEGLVTVPEITEAGVTQINDFNAFCQSQGAVCLLAGYPIAFGQYSPSEEAFQQLQEELENVLECEIISDFTDYFFDYTYFYDTQYHLTDAGVKLRTHQLAKDLLRWKESYLTS